MGPTWVLVTPDGPHVGPMNFVIIRGVAETYWLHARVPSDSIPGNGHHEDGIWPITWWRHQMETFSALLTICAGNSPVPGEFPAQRPVTPSFDVFFDLHPNKRFSKQWWGWWFETPPWPLWSHRNELLYYPAQQLSHSSDLHLQAIVNITRWMFAVTTITIVITTLFRDTRHVPIKTTNRISLWLSLEEVCLCLVKAEAHDWIKCHFDKKRETWYNFITIP